MRHITYCIDKKECLIIWPIFQLVKTFKILSFNRTAFFRPRNESVLEKVNELPALTSWANPTDWEKIIKSTNNYSDLIDEKERFQIFDFRFKMDKVYRTKAVSFH